MAFDLQAWDGFADLPTDVDIGINLVALNAKMAARKDNPNRVLTGTFNVPMEAEKRHMPEFSNKAAKTWIAAKAKEGWTQRSNVQMKGPYPAYDPIYHVPMLGFKEYRLYCVMSTNPKPIRIEVPGGLVKSDPAQTIAPSRRLLRA